MYRFADLFHRLDATTRTNEKVAAMVEYFESAPHDDAAWATYFLSGRKIRQLVPRKRLRAWAAEAAGIPDWLLEESYNAVGDLAETLALIVPPGRSGDEVQRSGSLLAPWVEQRLMPLGRMSEDEQRAAVTAMWQETPARVRLVMMKLVTGAFRVGVSGRLVTRAIAEHAGITPEVVAHRLMGDWQPSAEWFGRVVSPEDGEALISQPYPFCLAHPIDPDAGPESLGDASAYSAEWKWDGIRGQVIRRGGQTFLWSRGGELMENRWPEIESAAQQLPDGTVLDGEILASTGPGEVLPFAQLQRRIGRKRVGRKLLADVPVIFHAFDLLEDGGADIRGLPFRRRRERLQRLIAATGQPQLVATELVPGDSWDEWARWRETSRERNAEGLMLKRNDATYDVGRVRGTWWKWKVQPYSIDAVLIYAQRGHGKRASLYTDYTFALWNDVETAGEGALVPFAKAYSGLDDREIREVDRFVRQNTQDSFGPVRSVRPALVMELAFEGLQRSRRHKSGVATRFPRIVRWRHDKRPEDANRLSELFELLPAENGVGVPGAGST